MRAIEIGDNDDDPIARREKREPAQGCQAGFKMYRSAIDACRRSANGDCRMKMNANVRIAILIDGFCFYSNYRGRAVAIEYIQYVLVEGIK